MADSRSGAGNIQDEQVNNLPKVISKGTLR